MTQEQAERKMKALKTLAERGVGGEKETAKQLYEKLKKKYGIRKEEAKGEIDIDFAIATSMFYTGMMSASLQQELDNCNECPYQNGQEICKQCGTYENIKEICRRIKKAKQERGREG